MATKKSSKKKSAGSADAGSADAGGKDLGAQSTSKNTSKNTFGSPRSYAALAGLGALNALWAAFLWAELLVARQGGTPFCAVGEGLDCTALWDGGFAKAIHNGTGMPVAGWGVVFGIIAFVLPLLGLLKSAEGQSSPTYFTGTRLVGLIGLASLLILVVASAQAGTLCLGCLGTYILVTLYGAVALGVLKADGDEGFLPDIGGGLGAAAGTAVISFLFLLYPGLSTPKNLQTEGQDAIKALAGTNSGNSAHKALSAQQASNANAANANTANANTANANAANAEDPSTRLRSWLSSAPPQLLQGLSDSLWIYKSSHDVPVKPARAVIGDQNAPLLITDFTDARCGHCAQLHETLTGINNAVPPGSFKLESRHFPLDGACNPKMQRRAEDSVSCHAARAQICMEGNPKAYDFTGDIFKNGPSLTADKVWSLAAKYTDVAKLKVCAASKETTAKLKDDVDWAEAHELEGTPLVLLNGKKATSFGPFLFAMILTGGDPNHPALNGLPPPNKNAHVH